MATDPLRDFSLLTRGDMISEAQRIIDAARQRGIVLRLFGGLAVRAHCEVIGFCDRDYADIDVVGLKAQAKKITPLFAELGYTENLHVRNATFNRQLQFARPCVHPGIGPNGRAHEDDHVDVFLDTFKMDHEIDLKGRLEIEPYTIATTDLLLTKLQIYKINDKDVRDILTLLKDRDVGEEDRPGVINLKRVAELCAQDWGLFYDVSLNLQLCGERVSDFGLSDEQVGLIRERLARLIMVIDDMPKPLQWRLRARIGTRRAWHNEVEEQE